jgi:phage-related protein
MAIVGDAYVVVRAITSSVERDIKNSFKGIDVVGEEAGKNLSNSVNKGFDKSRARRSFIARLSQEAIQAKESFSSLTRVGYALAPALTALGGIIGLLGTGLISLTSIIGAAATPALITLAGAFTAVGQAALTLRLAFSGVAKAVQAGTKNSKRSASAAKSEIDAQRNLAKAYEDLADAQKGVNDARETAIEQIQQLGFDSEDAAINEQKAALELEKARETLARVSDLPPNSRARKEAQLAFAEADLNLRRAVDRNNDLKKAEAENLKAGSDLKSQVEASKVVVNAKKAELDAERNLIKATEARDAALQGSGADAYADALSNLSKEAQSFVQYLVSIQGEFKKLRDAAGQKLFPQLETAIDNLVKNLFPALRPLLTETGDVLGKVARRISEVVTSSENIKRLESIWRTNNKFIDNLGTAIGNLYEGFLILLKAAKPLIDAFGEFLKNTTGSWKETLKLDEATGKLGARFKIAQGILKDLSTILSNVFGGFKNLVKANVGPGSGGQIFLDYFKKVSLAFKNLETIDGRPLKDFFADAAVNGTKLLGLLGSIIGGFIRLADNKGLGIFLDQLKEVNEIFSDIGESLDDSLPSFGNFLIEFSKFIKTVTDSGSITIFFDTLGFVLRKLNEFLNTEFGQTLLKISAQVLPFLLAFGTLGKVAVFFGKVLLGPIFSLIKFGKEIAFLAPALKTLAIRFGGPIAIATALVTLFVGLYKNSEVFRKAVNDLVTVLKGVFIDTFNDVKNSISDAFPADKIEPLKNTLKDVGDFLGVTLIPIIKFVASIFIGVLGGAIKGVIYIISGIIDAFQVVVAFIKGILKLLKGDFEGAGKAFGEAFSKAISMVKNLFKGLISVFLGPLNAIISMINRTFGKNIKPITFSQGTQQDPQRFTDMAEGGIVRPTIGGTLARIGEAGRSERIEPLDPDGLSKRDKAMIQMLSGGAGSGINITINPSAGMDERELASIVSRQIAFQLRKGAA